jgi:hypothetical protein
MFGFEQHEANVPERGRDQLIGALLQIPSLVERNRDDLLRVD